MSGVLKQNIILKKHYYFNKGKTCKKITHQHIIRKLDVPAGKFLFPLDFKAHVHTRLRCLPAKSKALYAGC